MQHLEPEQRITINFLQGEAREDALDQLRIMLFETRGILFGQGDDDGEDGNEEGEGGGEENDDDDNHEANHEESDGDSDDTSEHDGGEPVALNAPNPEILAMFPGPNQLINNVVGHNPALYDGAASLTPNADTEAEAHDSTATEGGAEHPLRGVDEEGFAFQRAIHDLTNIQGQPLVDDGSAIRVLNPEAEQEGEHGLDDEMPDSREDARPIRRFAPDANDVPRWIIPDPHAFDSTNPHPEAAPHDNSDLYSYDYPTRPTGLITSGPLIDPRRVHPPVRLSITEFRRRAGPLFEIDPLSDPLIFNLAEMWTRRAAGADAASSAESPATEAEDAGPVTPEDGEIVEDAGKGKERMWGPPGGTAGK
jgi:hypothetical protein